MRILFLTDNFPPEVNAPASRTHEHARLWAAAGAQVTVVTPAPNYPHGRTYTGYRNRWRAEEWLDGVRVVRVWTYMTANRGFGRRLLDHLSYAATGFLAGLAERADVIVATSPQFFTTWAGCALSRLRRVPWVFELRDLWPESAVALGMGGPRALARWLSRVELALYHDAARVVALTPAFRDRLVARGVRGEKVFVAPNGANLEAFRPGSNPGLRSAVGADGRFLVAYIGTHGLAHGLDTIVDAMAELPGAHLLCVGEGATKRALVARARAAGLANVTFWDGVPRAAVPGLIAGADAMLVHVRPAPVFETVIPSKIFEAAAMEKPILLGVAGQARTILDGHGAGLAFAPGDAAGFVGAVQRLAGDAALAARLGAGGARLARAYDRRAIAAAMLGELERVAAEGRR